MKAPVMGLSSRESERPVSRPPRTPHPSRKRFAAGAWLIGASLAATRPVWPVGARRQRPAMPIPATHRPRPDECQLIVGSRQGHLPPNIAADPDVPAAHGDTYDIAGRGIAGVTLIFAHQGTGVRSKVDVKRQGKVSSTVHPHSNWTLAGIRRGTPGDKTTAKLHATRMHFV